MKPHRTHRVNRGAGLRSRLASKSHALLAVAAVATLLAGRAAAQPSWYDSVAQRGIVPGYPDFYQHQVSETSQPNGGFCTWFAYEDAMYFDHNSGFPNLYSDNPADWTSGMLSNFFSIYAAPGGFDAAAGIGFMNGYIANPRGGTGYAGVIGATPVANTAANFSVFTNLTAALLAGSNVLINIAPGTSTTQWWSYHILDVVGFNSITHQIVVMDPDNNQYGGYGLPTVAPNNYVPYSTNTTPNISAVIETGLWSQVGDPTNSLMQQYTVDANGNITDGVYAGTHIDYLYDIGPVPEPSVAALGLLAAAFTAWRLGRRGRAEG